jgi:hypothetical protein
MAKLDRLSWATCDWFEVEGQRFGIRTTSPVVAGWVGHVLTNYQRVEPPEPYHDPLFSIVAEDDSSVSGRTGKRLHILYRGTVDVVRTLDIRSVARSFLYALETMTFPARDDAVYLEASVVQGCGTTVLIPWFMVPMVNTAGRQIRRSIDLALPGVVTVALDHEDGHLIPVRRTLDLPDNSLDVFEGLVPAGPQADERVMVEEETRVDRVLVVGGRSASSLGPAPRGPALFNLGWSIRNLGLLGGRSVETVGRMLARSEVLEARWTTTPHLVGVLGAAVNGGRYLPDGTDGGDA